MVLNLVLVATVLSSALGTGTSPAAAAQNRFRIVSPQWVWEHRDDQDLRILDVRPNPHAYLAGHVPGAVHLPDGTLRGPCEGLPAQYLPPDTMAALLERAGIGGNSRVVIYSDGEDVLGATLVAYCLDRLGHDRVAVMDGGYSAFAAAHETTQRLPKYETGRFLPRYDPSVHITLDEMTLLLRMPDVTIIDARRPASYGGEVKTWARNGHVPGAVNLDWRSLVRSENLHDLRPAAEARTVLASHGIQPHKDVVVMCGTGREATLPYLVLKHVLGYPRVRLYEGSWTEWSAQADLPVEIDEPAPLKRGLRVAAGQAGPEEADVRRSGPQGVENLTGEVIAVERFMLPGNRPDGVRLLVQQREGRVRVHLAPAWFLRSERMSFQVGDRVDVKGSRAVFDGEPVLTAFEVRRGATLLRLRKEDGVPVWSGRG